MDRYEASEVAEELSSLGNLDLAALNQRWRAMTGRRLPKHATHWMALRMVAYRLQADALGDLDGRTEHTLDRIARRHELGGKTPTLASLGLSTRGVRTPSPGTILVREHDGTNHHVMVLDDGFAWNGTTYRSLSEVARVITGTRWNGYRFFGLTSRKAQERAE